MVTAKSEQANKVHGESPYFMSAEDLELTQEQRLSVSKEEYSMYIRALRQNWRQGTVASKGRSDVAFSNKKPWKQKGTGRARAGSLRSPLWRKGGVIFGPQERSRTLKITKKLKRAVGNMLLWNGLDTNRIVILDWEPKEGAPKTAFAVEALKKIGIDKQDIVFFVSSTDRYTHASFANIPNVRMLLFDQWNAFDVSTNGFWLVLKKDQDMFKELVRRWI